MNMGRWIFVFLLAAGSAGTAAAYSNASFGGTVVDGTPDYSDRAFAALEAMAPQLVAGDQNDPALWELYESALMGVMQPKGFMAGVRIVLRPDEKNQPVRETTTDDKGTFRFRDLAIGEYGLTIYKPAKGRNRTKGTTWRLKVEDAYRGLADALVIPAEFVTVRGRTVDSAGRPLAGIRIAAEEFTYNGESQYWAPAAHVVRTTTDEHGRYRLPGLHPARLYPAPGMQGQYLLRAEGDGFAPRMQLITAVTKETHAARLRWWNLLQVVAPPEQRQENKDVKWPSPANARGVLAVPDFAMTAASALEGIVRDEAGNPISKASLWLVPGDDVPELPYPLSLRKSTNSDENGRFSFGDLPPGHYEMNVTAAGTVGQVIRCEAAEGRTSELTADMPRAGTLLVNILRQIPREGPMYLFAISRDGDFHVAWNGQTNEAGTCVFTGLPPGENRTRAEFLKGECRRYEEIRTVIEAGRTNQVDLAVAGGCTFDLDLSFAKGGAARAWLEPMDAPAATDYWKNENLKAHLWMDSSGKFAMENLPAGEYRLSVQHFESRKNAKGRPWMASQTRRLVLEPGQRPAAAFAF